MRPPRPEARRRGILATSALGLLLAAAAPALAQSPSDIGPTKHNLSVSGPGPIRALTEDRICIFCHTPHNATPETPLWNRELEPQTYEVYSSPTLHAGIPQPTGPTKLCLSCHDGTIAMGAVVNPVGGIAMSGSDTFAPGSLSNFGLDLSGHHPVSFSYDDALPNPDLAPTPPTDLVFGAGDEMHCSTCHDPHNDTYGRFLVKDNRFSALCITCHQMTGWSTSTHATSTASVGGVLPVPPKTWPTWTQLDEWGCETCHTPHFAPTPEHLLNFTAPPADLSCTSGGCHSGSPGPPHAAGVPLSLAVPAGGQPRMADIAGQVRKGSAHHEGSEVVGAGARGVGGAARSGLRSSDCADCHNAHVAFRQDAVAPFVSGLLQGVSGVDRNGAEVPTATYEYEICLKCHGDNAPDPEFVPRVVASTNNRLDFDPDNPSYHPVVAAGRQLDVPSIPSSLSPTLSPSDQIYCSSCHADDEGVSNGPHGSSFPPILKERYETFDGTPESYDNYALCYRCHERTTLLEDASFRKASAPTASGGGGHSGHLAAGVACAACHDPHGVNPGLAGPDTGDHTHLINFDTRVALPLGGASFPIFRDTGVNSGNCTLVCHGVTHDGASYP